MPKCEAAILPTVKCDGINCLWLTNEGINDGSLVSIKTALKKEDPVFLQKIVDDKVGPLFRTCARRTTITKAAQKIVENSK